jgi:hypothetical protein
LLTLEPCLNEDQFQVRDREAAIASTRGRARSPKTKTPSRISVAGIGDAGSIELVLETGIIDPGYSTNKSAQHFASQSAGHFELIKLNEPTWLLD